MSPFPFFGSSTTGRSWIKTGCFALVAIIAVGAIAGGIRAVVVWQRQRTAATDELDRPRLRIDLVEAGGRMIVVEP